MNITGGIMWKSYVEDTHFNSHKTSQGHSKPTVSCTYRTRRGFINMNTTAAL